MKYYIGADLGTSSLKLMIVNSDGGIVASASRSIFCHADISIKNQKCYFCAPLSIYYVMSK